ncbi:MAG: hypothetical protein V1911_01415 [Candidatus Micrarchaeota archaeon]
MFEEMNGNFKLEMLHKLDKDLTDLGYKAFNPAAIELTKLCLEYKKKPSDVLKMYKEIQKGLL